MTKHARKSSRLQPVERPPAAMVQILLPVLGAFASIERSYFDLCICAGQQVLDAMMEQDRTELCGPRWKRDPGRRAGRAGTTPSEVTLGGRRIRMTRPRVRSQAGEEVELPSFAFASHRDPLDAQTVNAVACGISTRSTPMLRTQFGRHSLARRPPSPPTVEIMAEAEEVSNFRIIYGFEEAASRGRSDYHTELAFASSPGARLLP